MRLSYHKKGRDSTGNVRILWKVVRPRRKNGKNRAIRKKNEKRIDKGAGICYINQAPQVREALPRRSRAPCKLNNVRNEAPEENGSDVHAPIRKKTVLQRFVNYAARPKKLGKVSIT